MKQNASRDYEFWTEAMLPAWVVTDGELLIRNWNDFTYDLLETFGRAQLLSEHALSIDLQRVHSTNHTSIWNCILDPSDLCYVESAIKILKAHCDTINEFNKSNAPRPFEPLLKKLRTVQGFQGVTPYVYRPGRKMFLLGVKVSPPQGLKLIMKADIEGASVEYIDIVMAYRLEAEWSEPNNKVSQVFFRGVQPAIHDASERHRLWETWRREELENAKAEEQAQVTQFLSHAFKTPISNIQSMVGELQEQGLSATYRKEVCEQLESHVSDLSNLADLILFITSVKPIPTTLCASLPKDLFSSQSITVDEFKMELANTFLSVTSGRTRDPQDRKKIDLLAGGKNRAQLTQEFGRALVAYFDLAEDILDVEGLRGMTSFYLGLDLPPESLESARDITIKVKTTFLNLLLVELVLNAIKYADRKQPKVRVSFSLDDENQRLEINVINNGTELKQDAFYNTLQELAMKHGEKRRALGLSLNKRAAQLLGWELQWRPPAEPGTHLALMIPFKE